MDGYNRVFCWWFHHHTKYPKQQITTQQRRTFYHSQQSASMWTQPTKVDHLNNNNNQNDNQKSAADDCHPMVLLVGETDVDIVSSHVTLARNFWERSPVETGIYVTKAIALFEQVLHELKFADDNQQPSPLQLQQVAHPNYYNQSILQTWKRAIQKQQYAISPEQLFSKLLDWAKNIPSFTYDVTTMQLILEALAIQHRDHPPPNPSSTPLVAEKIIQQSGIVPNVAIYGILLELWASSSSSSSSLVGEEAPHKIETIVTSMKEQRITPDAKCYQTLLQFWGNRMSLGCTTRRIEDIVDSMLEDHAAAEDVKTLSVAIGSLLSLGNMEQAEQILERMMQMTPKDDWESKMVTQSICELMKTYRRNLESGNEDDRESVTEKAMTLFHTVEKRRFRGDDLEMNSVCRIYMDVLVKSDRVRDAEMLYRRLDLDITCATVLIQALGKLGEEWNANKVMEMALTRENHPPDVCAFNALIHVWAESTKPESTQQAFHYFHQMEEDPKCTRLGIRRDEYTYTTMFKALAKTNHRVGRRKIRIGTKRVWKRCFLESPGKKALELIEEMEYRHQQGLLRVKPTARTYSLALRSCSQDDEDTDILLSRLEQYDLVSTRLYNDFLRCWSREGTLSAAEKIEMVLLRMIQLARTKNPNLRPDVFTYGCAMDAFGRCEKHNIAQRVIDLYELMKHQNVTVDSYCFYRLLRTVALTRDRSVKRDFVEKADKLLENMETEADTKLVFPTYRHYNMVMKNWIFLREMDYATKVFMRRVKAHEKYKDPSLKLEPGPNVIHSVLVGWIKADQLPSATRFLMAARELCNKGIISHGPDKHSHEHLLRQWKKCIHPRRPKFISKVESMIEKLRPIDGRVLDNVEKGLSKGTF
jgi:hypothetical protein